MKNKALIWFTNDLRIHDNEMLDFACEKNFDVVAICFEPANRTDNSAIFYLDSAIEIKNRFELSKIPFFILKGNPVTEIPRWVELNAIDFVFFQEPLNFRSRLATSKLIATIGKNKIKSFSSQTLINQNELPFEIAKLPQVFTQFRHLIEKNTSIKGPTDSKIEKLSGFLPVIPEATLFSDPKSNLNHVKRPFNIQPGECAGLERLNEYFFENNCLSHYKLTRNGMLNKDDSAKLSPWLANGSVSVKTVYSKVKTFEDNFGKNESTQWFVVELLWRDYFKFLALKIGENLFYLNGIQPPKKQWINDEVLFNKWCSGQTGVAFVDANMIELNQTGWMSNRGRQNVASYLAKTLHLDWTLGAQYFQKKLIDNDTESNWGNWLYLAGVGTDPRDRTFDVKRQAQLYDPKLDYQKKWLKNLRD